MRLLLTEDGLRDSDLDDTSLLQQYSKAKGTLKISNISAESYRLLIDLVVHPKVVFRDLTFDEDWLDDSMLTLHKMNFGLYRVAAYVKACEYVIISGINLSLEQYPSNEVSISVDVFTANAEYIKGYLDTYSRKKIIDDFLAVNP